MNAGIVGSIAEPADREESSIRPQLPRLTNYYKFLEAEPLKAASRALPLWRLLWMRIPFGVDLGPLRQPEMVDLMHERFVNYVYSRLLVGACFALRIYRERSADSPKDHATSVEDGDGPSVDEGDVISVNDDDVSSVKEDDVLAKVVDGLLELEEALRDEIVSYLIPLCARILTNSNVNPSRSQRGAILEFAATHGHRCYLCGRQLHYKGRREYPPIPPDASERDLENIEKIREKSAFEIEHIWAQSRGGSRAPTNLAASCNECNKIKAHLISFADLPIEQILTDAVKDTSVSSAIDGKARFALLSRQDGRCKHCDKKFHDADDEELYAVKREWDEPYHFYNLLLVCSVCHQRHYADLDRADKRGINLRAKRKEAV